MIQLGLSDQQRDIVDGAAGLLAEYSPIARLRPSGAPLDVHRLLAEWGWFGIGLPEEAGGVGLGVAEEAVLYVQAGQFLLSPAILATTLAVSVVDGDACVRLLDGRDRAAIAIASGDGVYCFDHDGSSIVVLVDGDRLEFYPAEAFTGAMVSGLDETLTMHKGRLDASRLLAVRGSARATLLTAAMLAGIAKATTELAVAHAATREQFGQPIGAFQAVKHRCADMAVAAFSAEAQLLMAAVSAAQDSDDATFQIIAAAHVATRAARANGSAAIQVHGGMGFTAECDAHIFLKRAHVLARLIGGLDDQSARLLAHAAPGRTGG